MSEFLAAINLTKDSAHFNVESLMEICDWSVEGALNFFLNNPDDVPIICPKTTSKAQVNTPLVTSNPSTMTTNPKEISLSCGHVESNLPCSNLQNMIDLLTFVASGSLQSSYTDGEYAEYSYDNLTVILPSKQIEKLNLVLFNK